MKKVIKVKIGDVEAANAVVEARIDGQKLTFGPDGVALFEAEPGAHVLQYRAVGLPGTALSLAAKSYESQEWERTLKIPADGIVAGYKKIYLPASADSDDWPGPRAAP